MFERECECYQKISEKRDKRKTITSATETAIALTCKHMSELHFRHPQKENMHSHCAMCAFINKNVVTSPSNAIFSVLFDFIALNSHLAFYLFEFLAGFLSCRTIYTSFYSIVNGKYTLCAWHGNYLHCCDGALKTRRTLFFSFSKSSTAFTRFIACWKFSLKNVNIAPKRLCLERKAIWARENEAENCSNGANIAS